MGFENKIQMSGGHLFAAALDGGNTLIFATGENANESHYPPHKKNRYLTVSVLFIWADMGFEEAAPTTQNENILPEYALKYARQDQYGRSALRLLILAAFPSKGKKLWNNHIKILFVVIRKNSFAQISTTVRRSFSISFCKALFIYFTVPNEHFTKPCFRILHRDSMMKP